MVGWKWIVGGEGVPGELCGCCGREEVVVIGTNRLLRRADSLIHRSSDDRLWLSSASSEVLDFKAYGTSHRIDRSGSRLRLRRQRCVRRRLSSEFVRLCHRWPDYHLSSAPTGSSTGWGHDSSHRITDYIDDSTQPNHFRHPIHSSSSLTSLRLHYSFRQQFHWLAFGFTLKRIIVGIVSRDFSLLSEDIDTNPFDSA